ncbi:helix-turn-helix domain-containing protein [Ralstonia pseudosolanacearum]|uniref:helix-turn-helix domain-containing protein n=1 Tax=Ralstonia pseudosolanacearum TaxID=1310165 RepID=UPI002676E28E|nr:helix-turn-helix domain-containing protein [Ralstonia pseudosolanacearum]MDO3621774.1 helix-turn-helix domain-containing protein [Ralstonia pseudosolanacearum]
MTVFGTTIDLCAAAVMLGAHPETVRLKAKAGEIPGRKVGKRWMFSTIALERYLAGEWVPRVVQGDQAKEIELCRSINVVEVPTGITGSLRQEVARSYKAALAPATKSRRKSYTIA